MSKTVKLTKENVIDYFRMIERTASGEEILGAKDAWLYRECTLAYKLTTGDYLVVTGGSISGNEFLEVQIINQKREVIGQLVQ